MNKIQLQEKTEKRKLIVIDNSKNVKKSEFIVKGRYKLNPLALKFITTIITNIKRVDEIDTRYSFKIKDFADLMGKDYGELYNELEDAVDELLKQTLHIKQENGWVKSNWISSARYEVGEGMISFRIDPELRPYLLEVQEKFLQYKLENILKLQSKYSIRLYEILKDYYNTKERYGNKTEHTEKLIFIRDILQVPQSYRYNMFKTRILEKARKELAEYTDIKFDYEEIKTGRKITHIKFKIQENTTQESKKYKFMKSLKSFIAYLRKYYVNRDIIIAYYDDLGVNIKLSISEKGLLYDRFKNKESFNSTESQEIYEKIYKYAKENKDFREILANKEEFKIS